jgi:hypothetical protein
MNIRKFGMVSNPQQRGIHLYSVNTMLFLLSFEALLCARVNIVLSEVEAEVPTGEVVASSAMTSIQQE